MYLHYFLVALMSVVPIKLALGSRETIQTSDYFQACQCFDIPQCPSNLLAGRSLCSCINNAELFCYKRSNQGSGICPSPLPYDCENILANGSSTRIGNPTANPEFAASGSSFRAPYTGESGLNCVDLGYCFRPTKAKTTMTISLPTGTAIITVPVGLPALTGGAPQPQSTEPVIVFTQEKKAVTRTIQI